MPQIRAELKQLVNTPAFAVLQQLAQILVLKNGGEGLPASEEQQRRFNNAAIMRRGFELLWAEVYTQANKATGTNAIDRQINEALAQSPTQTTQETELL